MNKISPQLIEYAERFVSASQAIDYSKIIEHNKDEVIKLKSLVRQLVKHRGNEALTDYASPQIVNRKAAPPPAPDKGHQLERRKNIVASLTQEGFESRLGRVYCSDSVGRSMAFKDVVHRHGLPDFDMVIAPDFSPQSGLHGIFVTGSEVFSALLPNPGERHDWRVLRRSSYQSLSQMSEYVTLLAAGFDLP